MDQSHVITIAQEVEITATQVKESPKFLHKLGGKDSCCIFRVPQSPAEINREAYQPQIVSIGPYHHGNRGLEMIQEHKWRFLNDLITRTGKPLGVYMNIIVAMEKEIRESYSESLDHFSTSDLAQMMVLDGFFLIELFRKVGRLVPTHPDDPIFKTDWVSTALRKDLLRLENQIPFVVLKALYRVSTPDTKRTLQSLILEFFNDYVADWQPKLLKDCENLDGKHVLDFFRESFLHANTNNTNSVLSKAIDSTRNPCLELIRPATKLAVAGVKFKVNHHADRLLDIEFQNGLLLIPRTKINAFYGSFYMNSIALEQCCSRCSKDITCYVVFMGCLMNTSTDVSLLSHYKIIENYFGTDKEIAKFFNHVARYVAFDFKSSYLSGLFVEVNEYCNNRWPLGWSEFKDTSPWASISASTAFVMLSLVVTLQTFCTILRLGLP